MNTIAKFISLAPWTLIAQWVNIILLIFLFVAAVKLFHRINHALKKYLNEK